jgi:hypothetical protein
MDNNPNTENKQEAGLIKFDITQAAIAEMKEKYLPLKTNGVEDKDAFAVVKEARQIVKKKRIELDKKRKELNAEALTWQRNVNRIAQELTEPLEEIEAHLEKEEKKVQVELDRIKQEKQQEEQKMIQSRVAKLIGMGMVFNGEEYSKGELTMTSLEIKGLDDELFENFVAKIEEINAKEKAEADRLKLEQEEKEKALNKQKEEQEQEAAKIAEKKAKQEEEQKKLDEEKRKFEEDKENLKKEKYKARASRLFSLGMKYTENKYEFGDGKIQVPKKILDEYDEVAWTGMIGTLEESINTAKKEADQAREKEIEKAKAEAAEKAKNEAEAAAKKKAEDDAKAKEDADRRAKEEEENRKRLMPDIEKLQELRKVFGNINIPEVKEQEAKDIVEAVRKQGKDIVAFLDNKINEVYGN